ncbi:MAG: MBL fold metallo-hydrolase [Rectinemataceae bacterium]|nr:MBL fold metallo-hydrolase [Rectinemataceae bacterium]
MVTVESLGGSGEEARNCFYVSSGRERFLLDCGVRREISTVGRVYPLITKEIASSIDAVFLSHAHEDHSAALPYLYELGYRGPVFCHSETMSLAKSYMRKWVSFVKDKGGILPFDENNINLLDFCPLQLGINEISGVKVLAGRSAHMLGSLWHHFDFGSATLLYTGDTCFDSKLLKVDEMPACDILIADAAYAARTIYPKEQYETILASINKTIRENGTVLLPVPSNGRGIDLFLFLLAHKVPLIVDKGILKSFHTLKDKVGWISETSLWDAKGSFIEAQDGAGDNLDGYAVLCPDGMMTSLISSRYFEKIKNDSRNKTIISGHVATGTLGKMISDPEYRLKESIKLMVESTIIKVHPDQEDIKILIEKAKPSAVMLFHAKTEDSRSLSAWIENRNIRLVCAVSQPLSF